MITFKLRYYTELYNKRNPLEINEGTIVYPLFVKWSYEGKDYEFVRNDKDFISFIYVNQEFILVCYSEDSKIFPAPYNLVLYNLKKQMLKTIPPPKTKSGNKMDIKSMGYIKIIDGIKHISVRVDDCYKGGNGYVEIHYLNTQTFEYHPNEIETFHQMDKFG